MEEKTLYLLRKHPQGEIIVNVNHIVKIESGTNCIKIKLSDDTIFRADYTMQSIIGVLPIK